MTAIRDLPFDTLQLEQDGRVLTARYSHPPLNFMTMAFMRELDRLTRCVDRDATVGAVVLTGGIEGRFLTHLDARELGGIQKIPFPALPMRAPPVHRAGAQLRAAAAGRGTPGRTGTAGISAKASC